MKNSMLETSHSEIPARRPVLHGGDSSTMADRTGFQARLRFLRESAAYLDLELGRDELVRRFLRQPAGSLLMARG